MTDGYAFAFQVLGKLYFDRREKESLDDIILEYESEVITCRKIRRSLDAPIIKALSGTSAGKRFKQTGDLSVPCLFVFNSVIIYK